MQSQSAFLLLFPIGTRKFCKLDNIHNLPQLVSDDGQMVQPKRSVRLNDDCSSTATCVFTPRNDRVDFPRAFLERDQMSRRIKIVSIRLSY